MEELKALLENYFILKEKDRELYYNIREKQKHFKDFIMKLGYQLIVRNDFVKLEKLPGIPETFMGIKEFKTPLEYIFFMLILMFLEDKNKDDQFLLSHVTDFIITNNEVKTDFTQFKSRKALVNVMKFAIDNHLIILCDGESDNFALDETVQALYDSTGLSRYFVRDFPIGIFQCENYKDLENLTIRNEDLDKVAMRRNRVYRRLLLCPVVYNNGADDDDYAYIKNFKNIIAEDLKKYLDWTLQVHKSAALVIPTEKNKVTSIFPSREGMSDIVLLLNNIIVSMVKEKKLKPNVNEEILITYNEFLNIVTTLKNEKGAGFTKEYRERKFEQFVSEILNFMEDFLMCKKIGEETIIIYPLVGKIVGDFPEDFQNAGGLE